ncbi:MAG: class I SAM-dependent methyltransferase [Bacteroidota bacterium]
MDQETYFAWQKEIGEFGARVDAFKFKDDISPRDQVLDFGSGGGYMLDLLPGKEKIGIEINPSARENAQARGIKTLAFTSSVPDSWADVIISHHALEHTENPLAELKALFAKLKEGGKIIFVVPLERKNPYHINDINQHYFTWSEMNLGNLFSRAGFQVLEVKEIWHAWPRNYQYWGKLLQPSIFHQLCRFIGWWRRHRISQLRILASKTNQN